MTKKNKLNNTSKMNEETDAFPLLNKVLLRGYQRHDSIILNNFENITKLEVNENNIDYLDLSTLKKLQVLQCKRNTLDELIIDGANLLELTATNNDLTKILVLSEPRRLEYLDISSNKLKELPSWIDKCNNLQHLLANDNVIEGITPHIINNDNISLQTLQLANNKLTSLPEFTKEQMCLRTFSVHCNELKHLPKNLFSFCTELTNLNVSYNKLLSLPEIKNRYSSLEILLATNNLLNSMALDVITKFENIRVLHLAYNNFTILPSTCILSWTGLEELVISGNKLEKLPDAISSLKSLKVLRLHSNLVKSLPDLSSLNKLQVIDLAHNHLSKIDLETLLPKNVKFLDLSCNQQLQVDTGQLKTFQAKRSISFVDVTGKDRFFLPTSALFNNKTNSFSPWKLGFSESAGKCAKLWVSQLRLPQFCNTEGLFGMFDGQASNRVMSLLPKIIPTILLEHRANRSSSTEYMRCSLISAYANLKSNESIFDDCAILCHIVKEKTCYEFPEKVKRSRKYILRVAVIGESTAFLITKQGPFQLPPSSKKHKFQKYERLEKSANETDVFEMTLNSDDEFLVICSKNIWETVRIETVVQEIQNEQNLVLAAKKIQDIAQSFGVEQNVSIIILKFQNVESYVDRLINEFKQNVRKKSNFNSCASSDANSFENHAFPVNSSRTSPIGQSDQEISELSVCLKRIESDTQYFAEGRVSSIKSKSCGEENISTVLEEESDILETDSLLSEEQYKCWEYMLEQNTQLLFDKELNKITNLIIKQENSATSSNLSSGKSSANIMNSAVKNRISSSFPQLIHRDIKEYPSCQSKSKASKPFGSAPSIQHFSSVKSKYQNSRNRLTASEDRNLGYFGSLQQLLPYNFENEFEITDERKLGDDSVEYASRMSQYWGVTSTEL